MAEELELDDLYSLFQPLPFYDYHLPNVSIQLNGEATVNSCSLFEGHLGHSGLFTVAYLRVLHPHVCIILCRYPYFKARCSGCALHPGSRVIGTLTEYTTAFSLSVYLARLSKQSRARRKPVHIWVSGFCVI